jgi:hypothetical protein
LEGAVELLFLALVMGIGLGSMATAWATRRPEIAVVVKDGYVYLTGNPTQEDVRKVREELERVWAGGGTVQMDTELRA